MDKMAAQVTGQESTSSSAVAPIPPALRTPGCMVSGITHTGDLSDETVSFFPNPVPFDGFSETVQR